MLTQLSQPRTERIDGTDYTVGTPDHRMARAARAARLDAQYVEAHHAIMERNLRQIRETSIIDERVRLDANYTVILARELLFVRAAVERILYDELRGGQYVPTESHPRGMESYTTRKTDEHGEAKASHDLAGDSPRVDVSQDEDTPKAYANVRASYAYSIDELEKAATAGIPLPRWKAEACAMAIARKIDSILRVGDSALGMTGLFNNALIPVITMSFGEWLTATVAEIRADFAEFEQAIITNTRQNHPKNGYGLLLPTAYDGKLITTPVGTAIEGPSIKNWLLQNSRLVKQIEGWVKLDDASGADTAVSDDPMGILYPLGAGGSMVADPRAFFMPVAIPYEESPAEVRGYEWITNARSRVGGVETRQPKFSAYIENFD